MKKISITLLSLFTSLVSYAQPEPYDRPVHIGFIYPLSTNGLAAPLCTNHFSAHAIAGVSRSERGLCAAAVTNVVKDSAAGLVAAGFSNHIGRSGRGLVAAGFANTVAGHTHGVQAAGFINIGKSAEGAQLAGFTNIADSVRGAQCAGFINVTKRITGLQVAGFTNLADSVHGTQVAGFINIARRVKGVQIAGFINIADSSDNPIGLINLVGNGDKALGATVDETGTTIVGLRSGGKRLYGLIGGGYNAREKVELWALEAGLGMHILSGKNFRINAEGVTTCITDFDKGAYFKSSLRLLPALRINMLELFAGPTINYTSSDDGNWKPIADHYFWSRTRHGSFNAFSAGFVAGLQFYF